MFFSFADYETLRLALTSGAIPPEVSGAPVAAAFEEGRICARPSLPMPSPNQVALRRLGVKASSKPPDVPLGDFSSWAQLLPLEREPGADTAAAQSLVLFELADARAFTDLVVEILRLGNDRQGFRWVAGPPDDSRERVLLRVIGPPYYSMLRAVDRDSRQGLHAYVERSPGIWVEVGYRHPLQDLLRPPQGQFLLLRPPRDWQAVDDRPYQDIYEVLEFPAPDGRAWHDTGRAEQLKVPLRLTRASTTEPAELWVVRDRPVEQLDHLVREADDQLLSQLAFAVGELQGQEIVALRVRPGRKQAPPVLVLDAQTYRSYLRLPNLFLPVQTRLRPPLRRDAVRQHLAEDSEQIHWLAPGEDGSFTVESLPDRAFRPLSDWILYVLDHERQALRQWIESATFDFDPFICREQRPPKEKPERKKKEGRPPREEAKGGVARGVVVTEERKPGKPVGPELSLKKAPPSELQRKARELEERFLEIQGPPDAPGRRELLHELAGVYAALGATSDALMCGVGALWPDGEETRSFAGWADGAPARWLADHVDKVLASPKPTPGETQRLASCLLALGPRGVAAALPGGLGPVQHFLQEHENQLPLRAAWLVGLTLAGAAGGDVLALARTRDRLLERLYQSGLSAEQDLPSFMRFSASTSSDRLRRFRDWLMTLPERVHAWIDRNSNIAGEARKTTYICDPRTTTAYADLMLAFGLARLGEVQESQRLKDRASEVLGDAHDVHSFLLEAFGYRIQQALDGKGVGGPLPAEQMEFLEHLERDPRYMADHLRNKSRILEPHVTIDPYRLWHRRYDDPLDEALAEVADLSNRQDVEARIRRLLADAVPKKKKDPPKRPRVLRTALELAPRLGEAFALEMLAEVEPAYAETKEVLVLAGLLEKALFAAAHFGQAEQVQKLVARFQEFLRTYRADVVTHGEALAGQCFRGLRKLGMREEIEMLMHQMAEALAQGTTLEELRGLSSWPVLLRTLLHVAAGWFYFGKEQEALTFLQEARALLYGDTLSRQENLALTCRYVQTLGQAPVHVALQGIEELLANLRGLFDNLTTNAYYSASQLQVVEAIVLGIVTEDFALGGEVRRWLDDDEYLVRRRIHHDLQDFLKKAGH